jgi:hypothetical protein
LDGAIKKTRVTANARSKSPKLTVAPIAESKKPVDSTPDNLRTEQVQQQKETTPNKIDTQTIELIEDTLDAIGDEDGWAFLGDVGNLIVKKKPEFDPRNYGFSKLTPMLKSLTEILEIDERESDKKGIKHVFVRLRYS